MVTENKKRIEKIAKALDELSEQVVFVGGSVVEFYANDPATSDIRPTLDVDCVIPVHSRSKYWELAVSTTLYLLIRFL